MIPARVDAVRSAELPPGGWRDERRAAALLLAVTLFGVTVIAWWATVGDARSMSSMAQGLGQVGRAMPFNATAWAFMATWATMMTAMMLPAVAPTMTGNARRSDRPIENLGRAVAFACGYLAVWTSVGAVAFGALAGFRHLAGPSASMDRVGGAIFVLAGAYQFTAWKDTCLSACCRLTGTQPQRPGSNDPWTADVRGGLEAGRYCLGACGPLMALLLVVGTMNMRWMAGLTVAFALERHDHLTAAVTRVVGAATLTAGIAVVAHPELLRSLGGIPHHVMS